MLNQKLDFSFFESFIYIKIDVFALFTSFNSHSGLFPWKQLLKINCTIFQPTVDTLARNIIYTIPHYEELQSP